MISYSLTCEKQHAFDSWFQSAAAFDALKAAGHVSCPVCGTAKVEKSLMAPAVRPARKAAAEPGAGGNRPKGGALTEPQSEIEEALAAMRRQVEENSEYVGMNFVAEARAMHEGSMPERAIYGEARPEEARALLEEGVPVAPLPFMPPRKTN